MLRTVPLQSQIVSFFNNYIQDNNLKEGDRLPSQAELAKMMNVSVVSVREAVKTLEAKNILNVQNGKGVFVKKYSDSPLSAQIEFKKEKESFIDLIHIRKVLEKEVLSKLIKYATEEEIEELGDITAKLMQKYNARLPQTMEDRRFHFLTYEYCHSDVLKKLIMSIYDMLIKFQEYPLHLADPFTKTIPLHEQLFFAIRERKIKKAQAINNEILNHLLKDIQNA